MHLASMTYLESQKWMYVCVRFLFVFIFYIFLFLFYLPVFFLILIVKVPHSWNKSIKITVLNYEQI